MSKIWHWLKIAFNIRAILIRPPRCYPVDPAPTLSGRPEPEPDPPDGVLVAMADDPELPDAVAAAWAASAQSNRAHSSTALATQPQDHSAGPAPPTTRSRRRGNAEHRPEVFSFREAILDQLADYMVYLKRMRRSDRESYDLYSQVGAHIIPPEWNHAINDDVELSPWWRKTLPAFGAIASGVAPGIEADEAKRNKIQPRFMYFRRYDRPPSTVERVNIGAIYAVTAYWDKTSWNRKSGVPTEFPVCILPDGSVRLLRSMISRPQTIRHRKGKWRGYQTHLEHQRWGVHDFFKDWAAEKDFTPQQFLSRLFISCANQFEAANAEMIRIAATRDNITAVFSIDIRHTPFFFADREQTFTESGRRRRIFHITRTHTRTTSGGRVIPVRTHFRGARRFNWNGYRMQISVPHLHHADPASFSVGAIDELAVLPTDGKLVDQRWLGAMMAEHIDHGWKASA
jgi:hypothetical protein